MKRCVYIMQIGRALKLGQRTAQNSLFSGWHFPFTRGKIQRWLYIIDTCDILKITFSSWGFEVGVEEVTEMASRLFDHTNSIYKSPIKDHTKSVEN